MSGYKIDGYRLLRQLATEDGYIFLEYESKYGDIVFAWDYYNGNTYNLYHDTEVENIYISKDDIVGKRNCINHDILFINAGIISDGIIIITSRMNESSINVIDTYHSRKIIQKDDPFICYPLYKLDDLSLHGRDYLEPIHKNTEKIKNHCMKYTKNKASKLSEMINEINQYTNDIMLKFEEMGNDKMLDDELLLLSRKVCLSENLEKIKECLSNIKACYKHQCNE